LSKSRRPTRTLRIGDWRSEARGNLMQNQRLRSGLSVVACALLLVIAVIISSPAQPDSIPAKYQVGMRDVEWTDVGPDGGRTLVMTMFYPALIDQSQPSCQ
jgi:hypothetical protein